MRMTSIAIGIAAIMTAGAAEAQTANLSGTYRCVQACRSGLFDYPAYITQNGPELNVVDEAGQPSRATPDWNAPATRIWLDAWDESAVYTPDAMTIQFDNGRVWQRDLGPMRLPPPPPPLRWRR